LQKFHAEEFKTPDEVLPLVERAQADKQLEQLATEVHTASGEEDLGN
jgi:hypothetical protein